MHLGDVVRLRAGRYVGHDPAGGAMIVALLLSLTLNVSSGMFLFGVKHNAGPLAGWAVELVTRGANSTTKADPSVGLPKTGEPGRIPDIATVKLVKEVHEAFANITLTLVILHVCGVLLVSCQTKENLVWGMISGRKKIPECL